MTLIDSLPGAVLPTAPAVCTPAVCTPAVCTPALPVVVDRHGRGADVAVHADRGVTHVGQVRDLRPLADLGRLQLDVRAGLGAPAEPGARAQVAVRPDARRRPDLGAHGVAADHPG